MVQREKKRSEGRETVTKSTDNVQIKGKRIRDPGKYSKEKEGPAQKKKSVGFYGRGATIERKK